MQIDFHYYATYSAAFIAGYSHEEALDIAYSAFLVDRCSESLLIKLGAPKIAATTQLQMELMDANTDIMGLQNITRIWSSFHFLPKDLYVDKKKGWSKNYHNKYSLICGPNGSLVRDTVELAKDSTLQAIGVSMHVTADTWAHMYFAGTPSLAINNTNYYFYEIYPDGERKKINFRHNPISPDDVEKGIYTSSIYQSNENNIMNLGHGRAGHLPDYSYCVYNYLPSWDEYREVVKDNPSDFYNAYCQLIYAMKYIRGDIKEFQLDTYDYDAVSKYKDKIDVIINTRKIDTCQEWKAFGEEISGKEIPDFDENKYQEEYMKAENKSETFLGKFFNATIAQKSMVTQRIYESGNMLAGYSLTPDPIELTAKTVENSIKAGDRND